MMYGSETLAMKVEDTQKIEENRGEYDAEDVWRPSKEASVQMKL